MHNWFGIIPEKNTQIKIVVNLLGQRNCILDKNQNINNKNIKMFVVYSYYALIQKANIFGYFAKKKRKHSEDLKWKKQVWKLINNKMFRVQREWKKFAKNLLLRNDISSLPCVQFDRFTSKQPNHLCDTQGITFWYIHFWLVALCIHIHKSSFSSSFISYVELLKIIQWHSSMFSQHECVMYFVWNVNQKI